GRHPQDVAQHAAFAVVAHPVRAGAGLGAAGVGAHQAGAVPGGDLGEGGIDTAPSVVQQVRARGADRLADLVPPGVHADDDVRVPAAYLGDEPGGAPHLLLGRHLLTGAGLHAADVDDGGALGDGLVDPGEGRLVAEGGAAVVERVRRP